MSLYLGSQNVKDKSFSRFHKKFVYEVGPEWFSYLVDKLYDNISVLNRQKFALSVLRGINPGADLDKIKSPFLVFVLESTLDKFDHVKFPKAIKCVTDVIDLYKSGETEIDKFDVAARVARHEWQLENYCSEKYRECNSSALSAISASERASLSFFFNEYTVSESVISAAESAAYSKVLVEEGVEDLVSREACVARESAYESFSNKLLYLVKNCK